MPTNTRHEVKELTLDDLFDLLVSLPGSAEYGQPLLKRASTRWRLLEPAALCYTAQDGNEGKEYACIQDICVTGMGVLCENPVPTEATGELVLPLEDGRYKVSVRIAHCTQTVGGWRVGCQLLFQDIVHLVPMVNPAGKLEPETYEFSD